MEDFLYELLGESNILTKDEIYDKAVTARINLDGEYGIEDFIDHLVSLSILGRETNRDTFTFIYDLENEKKSKVLARKLGTNKYKIHNALVPALECTVN